MPIPPTVQPEDYANFLTEASDLLQTIEQELFHLKQDRTTVRVHSLMRAAHTLKGSAASIQLETVKSVAHVLEDVFRVLYNPDIVIDATVEALLFQAYECLRSPLQAEFTGATVDEVEVLERTATVLSQLQDKLGDLFDQETPIPTSTELGFDMVQSMFETGVEQRLQALEQALALGQEHTLGTQLQTEAEVFLGLAESLQLAGFGEIAQTTLTALAAHPEQIAQIASLAIADFRRGQAAVLAGDRSQGGAPSTALQQFVQQQQPGLGQPEGPPQQTQPSPETKPRSLLQRLKQLLLIERSSHPKPSDAAPSPLLDDNLDAFFERIQTAPTPVPPVPTLKLDWCVTMEADEPPPPSDLPPPPSDLPPPPIEGSLAEDLPESPNLLSDLLPASRDSINPTPTPTASSPATDRPPMIDPAPTPVVRVNLGQLERLDYLTGELLIKQNQQTLQDDQLRLGVQELLMHLQKHKRTLSSLQGWSDWTLAINSAAAQPLPEVMTGFDALEMDRYTDFHRLVQSAINDLVQLEMVGESLETQIRQARQARDTQKRLLTSIQDDLTIARMQPLSETLNRLPRVLQQLATAHSKPVTMALSGMAVLVDKAIAERLYSPLLHLVRNAFDHGIESPDLRRATGKPATGQIQIHAYHQGNRTLIEVRDDGQGIDWQRVSKKAIALGLVSAETARSLSQEQLAEFLFRSGFSTATQVNELSGRGVGLDLVQAEIQALQGTIRVSSTPGQGTIFTLSLPLSFSITRLLVCQDQGMSYALPMNTIQQVILPQPDQFTQSAGQQRILRWQTEQGEQMVSVHSLARLLNDSLAPTPADRSSQPTPIILLQAETGLWGLLVDQVLGEQELVIRPLGTAIAPPAYVYGCSILNDQQMALVIDPVLLQRSRRAAVAPPQPIGESATSTSLPVVSLPLTHILLIEDSLTVRHSLARTLQEQGYRVSQAGDGLEAFASLQRDPQVDLIISDIEMPRMSGFEFLSELRKTPALQTIPVVMLTSRSGSKYRQFAANLGANAFVNKPSSAQELLPLLESLINPSTLIQTVP